MINRCRQFLEIFIGALSLLIGALRNLHWCSQKDHESIAYLSLPIFFFQSIDSESSLEGIIPRPLASNLPDVLPMHQHHMQVSCFKLFSPSGNNRHYFQVQNFIKAYSESCRTVPPISSILKKESNLHWILFSLHKEIIEHPYSLWFRSE